MYVSHESPISFLEESRQYNDYDYALVHLFETHPEYYKFFKDSINLGPGLLKNWFPSATKNLLFLNAFNFFQPSFFLSISFNSP